MKPVSFAIVCRFDFSEHFSFSFFSSFKFQLETNVKQKSEKMNIFTHILRARSR